uniref:Uncharacterized protein n=1 Tax=Aegilops tauschii TaxID=37682 RepID=R7W4I8_AEGTA
MEDGRGDSFLWVRRLCSWAFMEDGRWDSILWVVPWDHNLHHPVEIAIFDQTSNVTAKFAGGKSAEFAGGTRTSVEPCNVSYGGYTRVAIQKEYIVGHP